MKRSRVARCAQLGAVLLSVTALACSGETRVSLLDPIVEHSPSAGAAGAEPRDAAPDAPAGSDPHLIHRYSFSGKGPEVVDSIGGASGTLHNGAVLDGAGHVVLDGNDDYVDLPDGLISSLESATLFSWLSWNGGGCWQRVFDFGSNDGSSGDVGNATSSVFASPLRCPGTGSVAAYELNETVLGSVDGDAEFPVLQNTSLAVVLDPAVREMRLFVAGKRIGSGKFTALNAFTDVNDWLGRSQWVQDIALRGSLDEFRIYDVALDDQAVAAVDAAGPDVP